MSRASDGWYVYGRGYKADDSRYGSERYGCLWCRWCGFYKPRSPPVFEPDLECPRCFLPITDPTFYFGALQCTDCDALIPCAHERTVVHHHEYQPAIFVPCLECADCGMPLKGPDLWGREGAICSYEGHPEYNNTFTTEAMNPGLRGGRVDDR